MVTPTTVGPVAVRRLWARCGTCGRYDIVAGVTVPPLIVTCPAGASDEISGWSSLAMVTSSRWPAASR
jgi:hypothetical protein